MLGHLALLIGGLVVGALAALVVVGVSRFNAWEREQHYRLEGRPREPDGPRIIGTCGHCEGDVTNFNGCAMSCQHYWHHTCATATSQKFRGMELDWSKVCRYCLKQRMEASRNSGLRNRGSNRSQCVECLLGFEIEEEAPRELNCKHRIHEACWKMLQEGGIETCSMCMEALSI